MGESIGYNDRHREPEEAVLPDLPTWRQKQQILYEGKADREERLRVARELIDAGWETEAIDYLEVEPDEEMLNLLRERALERGDAFLYRRASEVLGTPPSPADWEKVAARAEELGKQAYAKLARQAAAEPAAGGGKKK